MTGLQPRTTQYMYCHFFPPRSTCRWTSTAGARARSRAHASSQAAGEVGKSGSYNFKAA